MTNPQQTTREVLEAPEYYAHRIERSLQDLDGITVALHRDFLLGAAKTIRHLSHPTPSTTEEAVSPLPKSQPRNSVGEALRELIGRADDADKLVVDQATELQHLRRQIGAFREHLDFSGDPFTLASAFATPPRAAPTAEDTREYCDYCGGDGDLRDGTPCPFCDGSGRVDEAAPSTAGERAEAAISLHDAWLYFTGAEPSLSRLGQAIDQAAALLQSTALPITKKGAP